MPEILANGQYFYPAGEPRIDPNFTNRHFKVAVCRLDVQRCCKIKLVQRLTKGLQVQGAYSWSHSLDDESGQAGADFTSGNPEPQNPWNIRDTEWGNSLFDQTNVLSVNYTYELPFRKAPAGLLGKLIQGWENTGILNITSGLPIDVENSSSLNQDRANIGDASRLFESGFRPQPQPLFSAGPYRIFQRELASNCSSRDTTVISVADISEAPRLGNVRFLPDQKHPTSRSIQPPVPC